MLILLTILKWIGIVLLCILGLVLLILLLTLFSPITYNVQFKGSKESIYVQAKMGWFLYLIRPIVTFEDNELKIKVRIFGIPINLSGGGKESPKKSEKTEVKADEVHEEKEKPAEIPAAEEPLLIEDKEAEAVEVIEAEGEPEPKAEVNEEVTEKKSFFDKIKDKTKREKKPKLSEEEKQKLKEEKQQKREETKKKIREGIDKAKKIWAYLQEEETRKAIALIKDVTKKVLRHILPRRFKGHINLGFEDPSTTGTILAAVGGAYPIHRGNLGVTPVFDTEEMVLDGEARIHGHIFIIFFVIQGLRVLTNKRIMSLIKKAMK